MARRLVPARADALRRRVGSAILKRRRSTLVLVAAGLIASIGTASWAAFSAYTSNPNNQVQAGSVTLQDNDSGSAMLSLSSALPGDSDTACIKVTYAGSLPATVKLYGTTGGTGLDQYLDLKVTRGTYVPTEPSFDSCTNFTPDSTNYLGAGAGIVYDGTLQGFGDDYAGGLADPTSGSPATWNQNDVHVYKFKVTL